eukprot:2327078-Lingulodinium_polyedra.AAC.1
MRLASRCGDAAESTVRGRSGSQVARLRISRARQFFWRARSARAWGLPAVAAASDRSNHIVGQ